MELKEQVRLNAIASQQATSMPSGCKACQREGIPIFPLRVAAVPRGLVNSNWRPVVPKQDVELTGGEFKYALRTLRAGYLYVLLDNKVWLSYQVTAEGYMRQFNPFAMPEGETIAPITQACRQQGHCINASFINIDKQYRHAALAFSSDPWSLDVLEGYKKGKRSISRFTQISLVVLKESPASVPEAITLDPSLASLKSHVAEFATQYLNTEKIAGKPLGGAHGFYPRLDSEMALGLRVAQLGMQYKCQIAAVALNDAVGVVQELNIGRIKLIEACQEYIEQPGVLHKHIISESITQYIDTIKKGIAANSAPRYEMNGPAIGGYGPKSVSKEQVAEETFEKQYTRLMQSYDEPARAAFATEFERRFTTPEKKLIAIDKDLAAWYQAQIWRDIISFDYTPQTSAVGWAAQMLTLAACVQGGAMGDETKKVWESWLKKADSPAYLGFTGMQTSLLDTVFSGGNVYGYIKTALTSDEFGNYLKNAAIQRGWASRILAVTGSVSLLGKKVDAATRKSYLAMTQAAMLTAGHSTVVLEYETTFRSLKKNLKNNTELRQSLAKNNATFEAVGRRGGGAVVVDEIMGMHGKALDTKVKVQYSVLGTLEQIQNELPHLNITGKPFNNPAMMQDFENLFISDLSLQGKGIKGPIAKVSYAQLAKWNERGQRFISGDSAGLILGAGFMALQLSDWHAKADNLRNSVGTDVDAIADYAINRLLVVEGMAEVVGFVSKLAVKQNWVVLSAAQQVPKLVRFGAVLGGIAAVVDGFRNMAHWRESDKAGDKSAARAYGLGGGAMIFSGVISGAYGFSGVFALSHEAAILGLGPAGWAVMLLLLGIILVYEASELRSTAFEIWLRRTCFGIPGDQINNYPRWHADSLTDLAEAVVEYRAIVSGMVADVAFASSFDILTGNPTIKSVDYRRVDFRVSMPGWASERGGWSLRLTDDCKLLFSESDNAPQLDDHYMLTGPDGYYKHQMRVDEVKNESGKETKLKSLNLVVSIWVVRDSTPKVTLVANYWPDKTEPDYKLGLTLSAEQG